MHPPTHTPPPFPPSPTLPQKCVCVCVCELRGMGINVCVCVGVGIYPCVCRCWCFHFSPSPPANLRARARDERFVVRACPILPKVVAFLRARFVAVSTTKKKRGDPNPRLFSATVLPSFFLFCFSRGASRTCRTSVPPLPPSPHPTSSQPVRRSCVRVRQSHFFGLGVFNFSPLFGLIRL